MLNFKKQSLLVGLCFTFSLSACSSQVIVNTAKPQEIIKPSQLAPEVQVIPSAKATILPTINIVNNSPTPAVVSDINTIPTNIDLLHEGPNTVGTRPVSASTTPSGSTGGNDIKELATFNGKVYDKNGVPVDDATVSAVSSESGVTYVAQAQKTIGGSYVFRNAPVGTRVLVTVTKPGWSIRQQTVVLKSNLTGDPNANVLNFGTDNPLTSNGNNTTGNIIYAIQDEPEISGISINDEKILRIDNNILTNNLINNQVEIKFVFSEPLDRQDFESSVRLMSQPLKASDAVTIDKKSSNLSFEWADDDVSVKLKVKNLLSSETTKTYKIDFLNPFTDKSSKKAIKGEYIRISPSSFNDYIIFTAK